MPADRIHLVRHGHVDNPRHVVYADLPGFGISRRGRAQAAATARHLTGSRIGRVVSSPLRRAVETAAVIAAETTGDAVVEDERFTEWLIARRWAGIVWEDLPTERPGELEAYLDHPADLPFAEESLARLAARTAEGVADHAARLDEGDLVVVSHQDPIHAAHRHMTGQGFGAYHDAKPGHGAIVTLAATADAYRLVGVWEPPQGDTFPPITP